MLIKFILTKGHKPIGEEPSNNCHHNGDSCWWVGEYELDTCLEFCGHLPIDCSSESIRNLAWGSMGMGNESLAGVIMPSCYLWPIFVSRSTCSPIVADYLKLGLRIRYTCILYIVFLASMFIGEWEYSMLSIYPVGAYCIPASLCFYPACMCKE